MKIKTYTLNEAGRLALINAVWAHGNAKIRERLTEAADVWADDAEGVITDYPECPKFEIGSFHSQSGNPEHVDVDEDWFDVEEEEVED